MKKFLFLLVFVFTTVFFKAQLDTDHWFAPMGSNYPSNDRYNFQSLYLSTGETTPFEVKIFNADVLIGTVTISKDNPGVFDIPRELIITESSLEKMTILNKGLHVIGTKKYFANLRFSVVNHAENITSKGLASIGKQFFLGMPKVRPGNSNYTASIIATEDNTTATLSGYNPKIRFTNDNSLSPQKTVTLNKGESYIFEVNNDIEENEQTNGLIGAKIESDKPISVSSGSFSGQVNARTGIDIFMDQLVPVEKTGNEFVVINGNGNLNTVNPSEMEKALVVATEPNTLVYINDNPSPIATLTNPGDFYFIESQNYFAGDSPKNIFGLRIKTTKNTYVFQMLAGSPGNDFPSGGMNLIPALTCFLPSNLAQIPLVDVNPVYNGRTPPSLITNHSVKMNIITQTGAYILVNGSSSNFLGPFPIKGTTEWVYYTYLDARGNISIESTNHKAVTAGISGGSENVGFGGYYGGFSSVPAITKTGDCFSGTLLQVDDSYDTYQWFFNGSPIVGATTYFINPEILGSGTYTCQISKNLCGSETTKPYDYTLCPPIANISFSIGSCEEINIQPKFTTSTQTLVPSNSRIIVNPVFGTATINPTTGLVNYKVNSNLTQDEEDMFVFYVEGNGDPADFEYFRVNVKIDFLKVQNATLKSCSDATGKSIFNLESAVVTQEVDTKIAYFLDPDFNLPITNPTVYSSLTTAVYAKITSIYGCSATSKIDLEVVPSPNIDTSKLNPINCDDDFDGKVNIDFNLVTSQIVNQSDYFNVQYYLSSSDAQNGNTSTLPTNWSYTAPTTVYVRIDSKGANCTPAFGEIHFDFKPRTPLVSNSIIQPVCDSDLNGSETYDFKSVLSLLSTSPTLSSSIFKTELEAQKSTNPISNPTVKDGEIYYLRVSDGINCSNIAAVKIQMKSSRKSEILVDQTICPESKTILDAGSGYDYYHWSTGEEGTSLSQIQVAPGNYWVDLSANGCVYRQEVRVFAAELPTIESIEIKGNTATVVTKGGTPPLQYSLDKVEWFTSPNFTNLERGIHTVYLKSKDNCSPISKEFLIINLINIITPNDDGKNDVLDYSDLRIKKDVHIRVFDRYGVIQYDSPADNYIWDGKRNGRPLATGTYWYTIQWIEPDTNLPVTYSNWILLKNRD